MNKINIAVITCLLVLAFLTVVLDDLDILVSTYFYGSGNFSSHFILKVIHKLVPVFITSLIIGLLITLAYSHFKKQYKLRKRILYLILCLAIGPGLIVNTIFKNNFGRARPNQVVYFGGEKNHSQPFILSKECSKNCSFVSGHAAAGFYTTAFAYVMKGGFNPKIYLAGLLLGFITGIARIIQGGHFLSDILFSGIFVITVNYFLYRRMFRDKEGIYS
ncbi:MAG: phosphatase PAP2 family protein [Alphaproteobacteria bacterium]|nr:phosphatase PAP2 family protein [Alphaproteobacteria bacterium]OJV13126.1 MAG: hypothetical protein BGO27_02745 [Alphaproteobacteria bacterium 33-17]